MKRISPILSVIIVLACFSACGDKRSNGNQDTRIVREFTATKQNVIAAGENPNALGPDFPDIQGDMKIVKGYSATEINRIAGSRLEGTALPIELYDQLQAINIDLSKNDNPVLLVGSIKPELQNLLP